jgi:hypothetical protein
MKRVMFIHRQMDPFDVHIPIHMCRIHVCMSYSGNASLSCFIYGMSLQFKKEILESRI